MQKMDKRERHEIKHVNQISYKRFNIIILEVKGLRKPLNGNYMQKHCIHLQVSGTSESEEAPK